jgi:hypothetical protein
MVNPKGKLFRTLENIIFGTLNTILSKLVEKTNFSKRIFLGECFPFRKL